ncbi:Putative Acyl transferase domain superfamily, Acyl transferase/acyl hydrolase/lysophospholipase [Septoria linicola]|uniref:Acyl transferase domain superfamily, Acyl transferase/acyl hydrolase/lysophospholipase n=1 Tax=Septoria linicola TaxID=215465 RepID=A0A9Q9ASD2_9PEZI|nr:Putative Acyl transferase domain superfamily, Acyl transferase/acyl hydrolase/lysophospholipase [Septoria linicola]
MIATAPKIVFCFAGQGYVPLKAARDLYRTCTVFKTAIDKVDSNITSSAKQKLVELTSIPLKEYFREAEMCPA